MLARLAVTHRHRMNRRELAALLWPEEPFDATGPRLRQELNRLRRVLGISAVVVKSDAIHVALDTNVFETDVEEFESAFQRSKGASDRPNLLEHALEISARPFIEGALDDWIAAERRRLTGLRYSALVELAELRASDGETQEALRLANEATELVPHREDAHLLTMRFLGEMGHVADALGRYQALRQVASDSGRSQLSTRAEGLAEELRNPEVPPAKVSVPPLEMVGRADESARIEQWLHPASGKARFVSILGPGGVGKTHLLTHSCRALARQYEGLVTFVDLSEVEQFALAPDTILRALGMERLPSLDPFSRLASAFPKRACLLALDNLEQFASEIAPLLSRLLEANPLLRILVTSRVALGVHGEFRLPLAPLQCPDEEAAFDEVRESPAVRLLVKFASEAGVTLPDSEPERQALLDIVRKLEGLPLGIRLAAARLRTLSPTELLRALDLDPELISADEAGAPERHRSLKDALKGSFDLLAREAKTAVADLSIFRGGWSVESAGIVCGLPNSGKVIDALLDASLVERVAESGSLRFRMLDVVRQYAASLLPKHRSDELRKRHFMWLLEASLPLGGKPATEAMLPRLAFFDREMDNVREALRYAAEVAPEAAFELAGNLGQFWVYRTSSFEANEIFRDLFARHGDRRASPEMLKAIVAHSLVAHHLGTAERSEIYATGVWIGRELRDRRFEALFLALDAFYAQNEMLYDRCEEAIRELDRLSDEDGIRSATGLVYRLKGQVALYRGELAEAMDHLKQAVKWFRSRGEIFDLSRTRMNLARTAVEAGDFDLADAMLSGLIEDIRRIRYDALLPAAHYVHGRLEFERGRYESAAERFRIAREIWELYDDGFQVAEQDYNLGRSEFECENYDAARDFFNSAAENWIRNGHASATAISLMGSAGALWRRGEPSKAQRVLASAWSHVGDGKVRMVENQRRFNEKIAAEIGLPEPEAALELHDALSLATA